MKSGRRERGEKIEKKEEGVIIGKLKLMIGSY
jgi:hypothetical protein